MKKTQTKLTRDLNELLGRELGRTPWGEPIFQWAWSEDLLWPSARTGRNLEQITPSGLVTLVPEYKAMRQVMARNTWFMTKHLMAEDLVVGGSRGHGWGFASGHKPPEAMVKALWEQRFPGATLPAKGWRIATNASLPRGPGQPSEPNLPDTEDFIAQVKAQTALSPEAALAEMMAGLDRRDAESERVIGDEIRDSFPALLNPTPGKRGGFVSFPDPMHKGEN